MPNRTGMAWTTRRMTYFVTLGPPSLNLVSSSAPLDADWPDCSRKRLGTPAEAGVPRRSVRRGLGPHRFKLERALWVDTPVVHVPGRALRGRVPGEVHDLRADHRDVLAEVQR